MSVMSNQIRFLIAMVIALSAMEHGAFTTVLLAVVIVITLLVLDLIGDYLSGRRRR
ncbi:hypothetical protein NYP18_09035 [Corynebacterium sp. YIM 101645]|uniref:Uncharacterized protein n=1 Tax=Corynebacterium lemuris TaxID=1859292 RepID=A0ABT2FX34_9CORY|nr:hypothetical protein [Corynebacterium lemuris]MCS5479803.1 hypothetical protein [Corynebacterium lemuris]